MPPLVSAVEIARFRSIRHSSVALSPLCALVGEPEAGKSNLLAALRCVLDPLVPPGPGDRQHGGPDEISLEATLGSGGAVRLTTSGPGVQRSAGTPPPPVLFLPAAARGDALLASGAAVETPAGALFRGAGADGEPAILQALEQCLARGVTGTMLLMEEPELYLRPQGQRFLYRLLRRFAEAGNQVVYATHAPAFLNAARLDEVVFVERPGDEGTLATRPAPVTPDEDFRVLSEFDAERSELLLARAALLVEGLTEKLAFPFVFAALGLDHDREGVTIVECGGKSNIPLFARVCNAAGVPCVAVHDRDARPGRRPRLSDRILNALVRDVAGPERTIVVTPDFEGLAHLPGGARKPEAAWRRFANLRPDEIPQPLTDAVRRVVELARGAP
jgi:hypothetical protein